MTYVRTLPRLWPTPTVQEVEEIACTPDPVIRNLRITQAYHALAVALTDLFGIENVSWCAHATWASRTAGIFIREEALSSFLEDLLARAGARVRGGSSAQAKRFGWVLSPASLERALTRTVEKLMEAVAHHIGAGNHMVFAELGPLYAELHALFSSSPRDRAELERLLSRLKPGPTSEGGQELLIRAFTHYYEAMLEPSPKARAELLLLANLEVGFHEQTRLQGTIAAALNAPFRDIFLEELTASAAAQAAGLAAPPDTKALPSLFAPTARWLARRWRELVTGALMKLDLPDVTLLLGEDVPSQTTERDFPPDLMELEHPELRALLATLDRTPDSVRASAARDWSLLADRMNLIADVFRTRQQDRLLYDQPFTVLQVEAMKQGRIPHGRL